jgi:peptidoglycan hydrolase-like protein with peptidoglycan-binding domain
MANGTPVSRATGAGLNTVNRRRIQIFFQRFAGTNARSGIAGLEFTITVTGVTTAPQRTPADGKVEILLAAGDTAQLNILGSRYDVSLLVGGLHPVAELRGVQQRLNMLGYNAGALQGDNTAAITAPPAVENQSTLETELAISNFQADNDPLFADAICGPKTQTRIRNNVRNSGGE